MKEICHEILNKAIESGHHLEYENFQHTWSYIIMQDERFYHINMHQVEEYVMEWLELWKVTQLFAVSIFGAETTKIVSYPRLPEFIKEIRKTNEKIEFIHDYESFKKQYPLSI